MAGNQNPAKNAGDVAKEHIDSISARFEHILKDEMAREIIEPMLYLVSEDIYSTQTHFILELIQNVDDAKYADESKPTLYLSYVNRRLRTDCNELGFTRGDVDAICQIGRSTKKKEAKSTGEKGVGFKSVFSVAGCVWIASNDYTFKFEGSNKMGMLVPIWEGPPAEARRGNTSMYFQLQPRIDERRVFNGLHHLGSKVLIFLHKLRYILLHIELESGDRICYNVEREDRTSSVERLLTTRLKFSGENFPNLQIKDYFVYSYGVCHMPEEIKRPERTESVIRLAFPVDDSGQPVLESQDVYAYLPVRSYGFTAKEEIPSRVAKEKVLLCEGLDENGQGLLAIPSSLRYIPLEFRDSNGVPLTLCTNTRDKYLSTRYSDKDWGSLQRLGVQQMSSKMFIDDLDELVRNHGVQDKPVEWHRSLARAVNRLPRNPRGEDICSRLRELAILPLQGNEWVSSKDRTVFFPQNTGNIPLGLRICEICHDAMDGGLRSDRAIFFERAGAQRYSDSIVCDLIVRRQITFITWKLNLRHNGLTDNRVSDLAKQLYFLYKHNWVGMKDSWTLWVLNEKNEPCQAPMVYIRTSEPDSAAVMLQDMSEIEFIHKEYLVVGSGDTGFIDWLRSTFGIWRIPRLADRSNKLSLDFQHVIATTPSHFWLRFLEINYEQYSVWLDPKASKANAVLKSLRSKEVECLDNERAILADTCRAKLKRFLKEKKGLVLDPEFKEWSLLKDLGVTVEMNLKFYFSKLEKLKSEKLKPSEAEIFQLYEDIEHQSEGSENAIKKEFESGHLIYVPSLELGAPDSWLSPREGCIWSGPKSLRHTRKLHELYPNNELLFKKILKIRDAESDLLLKEIDQYKPTLLSDVLGLLQDADSRWKDVKSAYTMNSMKSWKIFPKRIKIMNSQQQASKARYPKTSRDVRFSGGMNEDQIFSLRRQLVDVVEEKYMPDIPMREKRQEDEMPAGPRSAKKLPLAAGQARWPHLLEDPQPKPPKLSGYGLQEKLVLPRRQLSRSDLSRKRQPLRETREIDRSHGLDRRVHVAASPVSKTAVIKIPGFPKDSFRDFRQNRVKYKVQKNIAEIIFLSGDGSDIDIDRSIRTLPGRVYIDEAKKVTVFMELPTPLQREETCLGEFLIARLLEKELEDFYVPETHWTNPRGYRDGNIAYQRQDNLNAPNTAFSLPESSSFTAFLVRHGCEHAKRWTGRSITYHLDVQVTSGDLYAPFQVHHENFEMARGTSINEAASNDVYVLVRLYNIYSSPNIAVFVDIWKLYTTGKLHLTPKGDHYTPTLSLMSSEPEGCYKYRPLEPGRHIRLFKISGGKDQETLQGSIWHTSLDANPSFTALSYTWGPVLKPYRIRTAEGDIPMRKTGDFVNIWADGISINQSDGAEKSEQISLLPDVYRQATQVWGWVGDGDEDSKLAMRALRNINHSSNALPRLVESEQAALIGFFARPWFVRSWIIQEVVLSRDLQVVCGSEKLSWERLYDAVAKSEAYAKDLVEHLRIPATRNLGPILSLGKTRQMYQKGEKHGLLKLFELFQHAKSALRRDRLFTLLNIAADREGFCTDYSSPLESVVCKYASKFVARGEALQLLYRARGSTVSTRFPSWIPDWTASRYPKTMSTWPSQKGFHASRDSTTEIRVDPDTEKILLVAGSTIDKIAKVGKCPFEIDKAIDYIKEILDFIGLSKSTYPIECEKDGLEFQVPIGNAVKEPTRSQEDLKRSFQLFEQLLKRREAKISQATVDVGNLHKDLWLYYLTAVEFSELFGSAVVCQTERGYIGLVPAAAEEGDAIALVSGAKVPFCLRHEKRGDMYSLLGEAYIHGVMHGEAFNVEEIKTLRFC
ncbi:hypothetical protein K505DRAFT_405517 [Melanomma pulvis-pyrius CBS 109.77]|uniref:Heterokaryon incompatibility domain-containing protein n=1 Tax=Melanomma pulvis-pyrius CBS 109.77 TaxID=1314802 RepID=A0A6A6XQM0_9PLEO|nr:hypothetical protein K505DRAFT_405517 [Melanomma pulvis-pyrius CBS 109.77]